MEINISGIIIEVRKKKIKNMYLSVKPPDGRVVISAPISMNRRTIEAFAQSKLENMRLRQKKRTDSIFPVKFCISGGSHTF